MIGTPCLQGLTAEGLGQIGILTHSVKKVSLEVKAKFCGSRGAIMNSAGCWRDWQRAII